MYIIAKLSMRIGHFSELHEHCTYGGRMKTDRQADKKIHMLHTNVGLAPARPQKMMY